MRIVFALAAFSVLSACATPNPPLLEQKARYPKLDVAMIDAGDELIISLEKPGTTSYVPPVILPPGTSFGQAAAAGAAGGLIAGLIIAGIESAERADAKRDIAPVQEALSDVRLGPQFREAMVASLRKLDWTTIDDVRIVELKNSGAMQSFLAGSDTPGVLTLATSNYLSRNASTLVFSARASLLPKPTKTTRSGAPRIPPPAFATMVAFEVDPPVEGARRSDFLPTWAADKGELIRAGAAQAEPILSELILRQMSDGHVPIDKTKSEKRTVHLYGQALRVRVEVLDRRQDGDVVRLEDGTLLFMANRIVPRSQTAPAATSSTPAPAAAPSQSETPPLTKAAVESGQAANTLQMAPIGDDAGLPGRHDKIDQSGRR